MLATDEDATLLDLWKAWKELDEQKRAEVVKGDVFEELREEVEGVIQEVQSAMGSKVEAFEKLLEMTEEQELGLSAEQRSARLADLVDAHKQHSVLFDYVESTGEALEAGAREGLNRYTTAIARLRAYVLDGAVIEAAKDAVAAGRRLLDADVKSLAALNEFKGTFDSARGALNHALANFVEEVPAEVGELSGQMMAMRIKLEAAIRAEEALSDGVRAQREAAFAATSLLKRQRRREVPVDAARARAVLAQLNEAMKLGAVEGLNLGGLRAQVLKLLERSGDADAKREVAFADVSSKVESAEATLAAAR